MKLQTRQGIRRVTGFVIALGVGAVLMALGFWLPPTLQDSGVDRIAPADQAIAETALRDAERAYFQDGVEQYLITVVFVDRLDRAAVPDVCPAGTTVHARVRARTAWWIPYDNVLWCGDDAGRGLFLTRQA